ncbi:hypothetical protein, partial [Succinimonas amylolytica]|uniref:hypothetical protein n=1 Tax=Succinimonas amylolytica TaxID=83769 RepID=UPI001B7F98F3
MIGRLVAPQTSSAPDKNSATTTLHLPDFKKQYYTIAVKYVTEAETKPVSNIVSPKFRYWDKPIEQKRDILSGHRH